MSVEFSNFMIMQLYLKNILFKGLLLILVLAYASNNNRVMAQKGPNDTIVVGFVIYNGDTMESKTLSEVYVAKSLTQSQLNALADWTRLRNAVYVTYPYAKRAGAVLNDINLKLAGVTESDMRKDYIKSKEGELRKEFTDPLTNLSVYQGKVLMKLINRETGNNCYAIIKEYKGGFTARLYQTVAFFFSSNLKQPYDPTGEDAQIEKIVQEVQRMYGYGS